MIKPLPPETLAWLRQAAALDGDAYSQVLLHLLERMDAQEARDREDASCWASVRQSIHRLRERIEALEQRPIFGFVDLAAPTPETAQVAAPVADDDEPQTLHTIALRMVDTLEQLRISWPAATSESPASADRSPNPGGSQSRMLPEILDTLRRAIREPMERPTPEAAPVAADCSALDAMAWAYIGKQSMCGDPAATALIDLLNKPPAPQPAPPAAPAGELVERVADAIGNADYDDLPPADLNRRDARAAIREVAAWLRQRTGTIANGSQWADMIEQEADR
jgi:hypothetical protein